MEERRYRAYVTDSLMTLVENVANGLGGKVMTARWIDPFVPKDERTADEIIQDVIKNAGLKPGGGEQ